MVLRRDPLSLGPAMARNPDGPIAGRTALVMPAHNEDPERIMSGLAAVLRRWLAPVTGTNSTCTC